MPEHDDRYARSDLPRTTGEFRAAPDASASTAEFKAFVAKQDPDDAQRGGAGGAWPEQPWAGQGKRSSSRRTIALVAAGVAVVAIVIAIIVAVA
ncbi:MAG: hypothetical protein ACTHJW_28075 [Streptosporangiaceae bacterium]